VTATVVDGVQPAVTTAPASPTGPEEPVLSFERTVERTLVHKRSLAEVLLTDHTRLDAHRYATAAHLPTSHGYFGDHTEAGSLDPLLILEAVRQSATCGAHLHADVPRSAVLVLNEYTLDLAGPVLAYGRARPADLVAITTLTGNPTRRGRPQSLSYATELFVSGRPIGAATMGVTAMAGDQYQALRRMTRRGEPPTASEVTGPVRGAPVDPARVHRFNPANVTICALVTGAERAGAHLDIGCYRNRSMFDHPYDHVPAMVLTEAARQLALAAADTSTARIRGLRGSFTAFAELDRPVRLCASLPQDGPVRVEVVQRGQTVAGIEIQAE
jgi:hypothetical protein